MTYSADKASIDAPSEIQRRNLEAVVRGNAVLEAGDREAWRRLVAEIIHPRCEWTPLLTAVEGKTYRGREGMLEWFDDFLGSFEVRYEDPDLRPIGDTAVVFLSTMALRGRESGADVQQDLGAVFRFEDGLLSRGDVFGSHAEALEAAAVALVEAAYRVLAEDGVEALLERYEEFFGEDFEWEPALVGSLDRRRYAGRDGFKEYWQDFMDAFDAVGFGDPVFELAGPGRVLVASTIHVRGAGGGVPIDQEAGFVFEVRDGRIVEGRSFFSRHDAEEFAASA